MKKCKYFINDKKNHAGGLNAFPQGEHSITDFKKITKMAYKRLERENMEGLLTNGRKKFVKYDEGAAMYSMGLHSFMDLAKEAKAIYRIT